jgi:hypothetical protein
MIDLKGEGKLKSFFVLGLLFLFSLSFCFFATSLHAQDYSLLPLTDRPLPPAYDGDSLLVGRPVFSSSVRGLKANKIAQKKVRQQKKKVAKAKSKSTIKTAKTGSKKIIDAVKKKK